MTYESVERKLRKLDKANKLGFVGICPSVSAVDQDLLRPAKKTTIDVFNSHSSHQLHHFRVLQLRSHEDTGAGSECKLRFHFFFKMFKAQESKTLQNFEWNVCINPVQRLYLSQDTRLLMEVINNFIVTVYRRVNTVQDDSESSQSD